VAPPLVQTVRLFRSVWGCGNASGANYYHKGYRTLEDLSSAIASGCITNARMAVGLKYHDDFQKRIPRSEVRIVGGVCVH
jgi:hypothetical protein